FVRAHGGGELVPREVQPADVEEGDPFELAVAALARDGQCAPVRLLGRAVVAEELPRQADPVDRFAFQRAIADLPGDRQRLAKRGDRAFEIALALQGPGALRGAMRAV